MSLHHECRFGDPDAFYEALIQQLRDLDDPAAQLFQARLLLVLANHIGDAQVLAEAMQVARRGLGR